MVKHGAKLLWVKRRNLLRQLMSSVKLSMKDTNFRAATRDAALAMRHKLVTMPTGHELLKHLETYTSKNARFEKLLEKAKKLGVQVFPMLYEDLNATFLATTVRPWLLRGVTGCTAAVDPEAVATVKIHVGKMAELTTNWPKVRATLNSSRKFRYLLRLEEE